ncbi:MAG: hypothetical protein WD894_24125 [Pirellulales bacterium]
MNQPDERSRSAIAPLRVFACRGVAFVVLLALSGCQSPAVPFDPFLVGRTTIPPPGTAAPATAAPYYDTAPPVVSVPGASTIYPPPGITPAPVPATSLPPAGSGRFPRGITLPQASTQSADDGAQLLGWQPADSPDLSDLRNPATRASGDDRAPVKSNSGVVRASHEEPRREPPIRIVGPKLETKL